MKSFLLKKLATDNERRFNLIKHELDYIEQKLQIDMTQIEYEREAQKERLKKELNFRESLLQTSLAQMALERTLNSISKVKTCEVNGYDS